MNSKPSARELELGVRAQAPLEAFPPIIHEPEPSSLMAVIAAAARDPNTDVTKLERLMGLYERVTEREARIDYTAALAEMQKDLPSIVERGGIKNKSGDVQSTYALWEDVNDVIRPLLAQHGFVLSFRTGHEGDKISVTGVLSHKAGHSEQTTMHLPHDMSGSKNAVQGIGSSTSYGKRYTAFALLNLTSRGEDDDGRVGGGDGPVTEEQRDTLLSMIDRAKFDIVKICTFFKVEAIADIKAKDFPRVVEELNLRTRQKEKMATK